MRIVRCVPAYLRKPVVADLDKSRRLFELLGFSDDERVSDDTALALRIGEGISARLLTCQEFAEFAPWPVAYAKETPYVLVCPQVDRRAEVGRIVGAPLPQVGNEVRGPQDHGSMEGRAF